jgi:hypothetical protein
MEYQETLLLVSGKALIAEQRGSQLRDDTKWMAREACGEEIKVDNHQNFSFILGLPVTKIYYGLMRCHPDHAEENGTPLIRYVRKLWSPMFSFRSSNADAPKFLLVACEVD